MARSLVERMLRSEVPKITILLALLVSGAKRMSELADQFRCLKNSAFCSTMNLAIFFNCMPV